MRCIYVDEFAIVVNTSIKHFQDNGGCDVFKDPEEHIVSSELWRNTVKASDKLFMQVVKILKMSNHKFVSALLSKTVRKVLIKAGVTIQEDHFYLTVHPVFQRMQAIAINCRINQNRCYPRASSEKIGNEG